MSRIEIPMKEYKDFKNKINELEKTLVDTNKEISKYKNENQTLKTILEDILNSSFNERIFKWGEIKKEYNTFLKDADQ